MLHGIITQNAMPRLPINKTTYFELRSLADIAQLPSFVEQRDIDTNRLRPISQRHFARMVVRFPQAPGVENRLQDST